MAINARQSGAWTATATWTGDAVPGNGDEVVIGDGFTVDPDPDDAYPLDETADGPN